MADRHETDSSGGMHGFSTLTENTPQNDWIILHVDCDCFYAACERTRDPSLEHKPLVIGMGYESDDPHGAVATASYEARDYGVESAMAIGTALDHLPRMVDADCNDPEAPNPDAAGYYRPVDMNFYESIGSDVHDILATHADTFEPVSIDEAYLDVTNQTTWQDVYEYAQMLKQKIQDEVGVPVSIGAAPTKSAAKVASDHDKPDGLVVVEPGTVRDFFAPLDIEEVHGIGPVTATGLREMGIETAGKLATTDPNKLTSKFGSRGKEAHQRARGHDPRPVTPPEDPKSLSNESSFGDPVTDHDLKKEKVCELVTEVTTRAQEKNALYQTIGIKIVQPPFDVKTRAHTLSGPVDNPDLVESITLELLEEFSDDAVRKVGVKVSKLSFSENQQPALTEWESDETVSIGDCDRGDSRTHTNHEHEASQTSLTEFTED